MQTRRTFCIGVFALAVLLAGIIHIAGLSADHETSGEGLDRVPIDLSAKAKDSAIKPIREEMGVAGPTSSGLGEKFAVIQTFEEGTLVPVPNVGIVPVDSSSSSPRGIRWNTAADGTCRTRLTHSPKSRDAVVALCLGFEIRRVSVPEPTVSNCIPIPMRKALPIHGVVTDIPIALTSDYRVHVQLHYERADVSDDELRNAVHMKQGLTTSEIDDQGRFELCHLFANAKSRLDLFATHIRTGTRHRLKTVTVESEQEFVTLSLAGMPELTNGTLAARIEFGGRWPRGKGELSLLSTQGIRHIRGKCNFERPADAQSVKVEIAGIPAGMYIPSILWRVGGTYQFPPIRVGELSTATLEIPVGGTIVGVVTGAVNPSLRANPVALFATNDKGVRCGASDNQYLKPNSNRVSLHALPPGEYCIYVIAGKQRMRSESRHVVIGNNEEGEVDLPLRRAYYFRVHFDGSTTASRHLIRISTSTGSIVDVLQVHPRVQTRRLFLSVGKYVLTSDIPGLQPRLEVIVKENMKDIVWDSLR